MGIFHCYVSLPECFPIKKETPHQPSWKKPHLKTIPRHQSRFFGFASHGDTHHCGLFKSNQPVWPSKTANQVIQAVTFLSLEVTNNLWKGSLTFSPSQKGHQQNCQEGDQKMFAPKFCHHQGFLSHCFRFGNPNLNHYGIATVVGD